MTMPAQTFRVTGRFPSGKERTVNVKLTNFRADPEDVESMDIAFKHIRTLTPQNFSPIRDTLQLIGDQPEQNLGIEGVDQLTRRPMELQTDTIKSIPISHRPTDPPEHGKTISWAVNSETLSQSGSEHGLGDEAGSDRVNQQSNVSEKTESSRRPPGSKDR
jgi:hypothetical protein